MTKLKHSQYSKLHHLGCALVFAFLITAPVPIIAENSTTSSESVITAANGVTSELPSSTTTSKPDSTTTSAAVVLPPIAKPIIPQQIETPQPPTLPEFIITMMKKFGATKAIEAFQSLDQLPLGLIMKILLVEMDRPLAADIVAMQRYAQSADKSLIQMIGRIVAGDKDVPKEIFTMDLKLLKFPWWMRIRQRMLNNLEKYVAAYSLVPVAAKTAISGASSSRGNTGTGSLASLESLGPQPALTQAVAASATESSSKLLQVVASTDAPAPPLPLVPTNIVQGFNGQSPARLSLLNPLQQQQVLESLALANAAAATQAQVQQLLQHQQQQQTTKVSNPFAFLLG